MTWLNAIVQGALLGGLYALFASGLSLMFGVMRFVNLAHGDFIVVAAYLFLSAVVMLGLNPFFGALIVVASMSVAGYAGQRILLNRILGPDILPPVLVTFGLSIIVQNGLLQSFNADSRHMQSGWLETTSFSLPGGIAVGLLPLLTFATAGVAIGLLHFVFYHTSIGRLLRATSDDPEIVPLVGGDNAHIFALSTAIASAVVAVAGIWLALKTNFDPSIGPSRLLFAFEAVIIGGLGNLWGTLAGGIVLGVAQTLGGEINPGVQILAGHLVFMVILIARPGGLFPKVFA